MTRRCPATEVNPETAVRDINVPQELMRLYGNVHLGIYLQGIEGGEFRVGDKLVRAD